MGKGSAVRGAIRRTREAYSVFAAHRATSLAGMLVFFLIMSLVPFLFWLTLLFGDAEGLFEKVLALELFGWARELILFLRDNAQGATAGAGIVLLATTLWSSSAFFYHLRRSGEIVYDRTHEKGWRVRVLAIMMTFAVLLFFSAAGGLFALLAFAVRALHPAVRYASVYSAALLLGFFAAWLLNIYICPYPHSARRLALGSLLTALAWLAASALFSVYLTFSDKEKLYGALALVIVFFLWLYWLMICFMAGVIYNKHRLKGE